MAEPVSTKKPRAPSPRVPRRPVKHSLVESIRARRVSKPLGSRCEGPWFTPPQKRKEGSEREKERIEEKGEKREGGNWDIKVNPGFGVLFLLVLLPLQSEGRPEGRQRGEAREEKRSLALEGH